MKKKSEENKSNIIESGELLRICNSIKLKNEIVNNYPTRFVPFRVDKYWYIFDIHTKYFISEGFSKIKFIDNSLKSSKSLLIENKKYYEIIDNKEAYAIITNPLDLKNIIWYSKLIPLKSDNTKMIAYFHGKYGLIDSKSKILIPFTYDIIIDYLGFGYASSHGILIVKNNNKFGIIDLINNEVILPIIYDSIEETKYLASDKILNHIDIDSGLNRRCIYPDAVTILKVKLGNKIGAFHCKTKSLLFLAEFKDISWCKDGICSVKINSKWALFDYQLNQLINDSEYDSTSIFTNGYSICEKKDCFYAVFKNGYEYKLNIKCEDNNTILIYRYNDVFIAHEINTANKQKTNKFYVYQKFKLRSIIEHEARHGFCNVILRNNIIEIITDTYKYGLMTDRCYNLDGEIISEYNIHNYTINNSESNGSKLLGSKNHNKYDSNWIIVQNKLFYKNDLVFEAHSMEGIIADLTLDLPKLCAFVDVELYPFYFFIGYIDQYGNKFWYDSSEKEMYKYLTYY